MPRLMTPRTRTTFISIFIFVLSLLSSAAFSQSASELHETGRSFMQQGDYANAVLVLGKAQQLAPADVDISKDLALTHYLNRDNAKALETIRPLIENDAADDQAFQLAGSIYKQGGLIKECEKLYKKAIKKFPGSGPLYNDYGELLWEQRDYSAIKQWEKGIESEPGYSRNYYNAAKYYFLTTDKTWGLIYGEIFANMEPFGNRTPEIKRMMLEGYKKLFSDEIAGSPEKNKFTLAFTEAMQKQSFAAASGISAETLTMIRTRFILDWFNGNAEKFPFRLFEYQQQLLREGMFDAYNQWLFGSVQNLTAYQGWTNTHASEYNEFSRFQKGRIFKLPQGQYYHQQP
jgi:tetratricopeptide (TPR) repeat protein